MLVSFQHSLVGIGIALSLPFAPSTSPSLEMLLLLVSGNSCHSFLAPGVASVLCPYGSAIRTTVSNRDADGTSFLLIAVLRSKSKRLGGSGQDREVGPHSHLCWVWDVYF